VLIACQSLRPFLSPNADRKSAHQKELSCRPRGVVPDHKVDGFNSQAAPVRPPQAAMFDKGASSLPEIHDACDQRPEHSRQLSDPGRAGYPKQSPNS
jgi:hypothetical protein